MTGSEILAVLRERRVEVTLVGGDLKLRGKREVLADAEVMALVRAHKPVIRDALAREACELDAAEIPADSPRITPEMLSLISLTQAEIDGIVAAVPGGAANVQNIYPLAPLQEGILFHSLMTEQGDPYIMSTLLRFEDRERLDAYLAAVQLVVQRHDILRTAIAWHGLPEPVQIVWRRAPVFLEEVVLDKYGEDVDVPAQLRKYADPRLRRLDVTQAPLKRLFAARSRSQGEGPGGGHDCWWAVELTHHLSGDHTTLEIIRREIRAYLSGDGARLPVPVPFCRFLGRAKSAAARDEHRAFFTRLLGDFREPTAVSGLTDIRLDGRQAHETIQPLDAETAARLRRRASAFDVSPASIFHLAWALVLGRLSGQDDVVFGTVLFGRMQGERGIEEAAGIFINTLPARIAIGRGGARECLRAVHRLLTDLLHHERASLTLAQACSGVVPPAPLFTTFLNYRHDEQTGATKQSWNDLGPGVTVVRAEEWSHYPVVINVDDDGRGFTLNVQSASTASADYIGALVRGALVALLAALKTAPEASLEELEILSAVERRRLVVESNATVAPFPEHLCIHQLVASQAERQPDAVAVVYDQTRMTYAELDGRATVLGAGLQRMGVGPDERVAICMERSPDMVVAMLAVLKAGAAYVPLDPAYPAGYLADVLRDSRPKVVLTDGGGRFGAAENLRRAVDAAGAPPAISVVSGADAGRSEAPPDSDRTGPDAEAGNLAYLIFTSGSSGRPKGVMVEHRALMNHIAWQAQTFSFGATDTFLQRTSVSFDASVWELWTPLAIGARLWLLPNHSSKDPGAIAEVMASGEITIAQFVPTLLQAVIEERREEPMRCRLLFCGGEPLDPTLAAKAAEHASEGVVNLYGPTETTIDATFWRCTKEERRVTPIGRPIWNTRVYVLDGQGRPAPVGVTGELHVAGTCLARGYFDRTDLTADRFIPDPWGPPGSRRYRTGDLARYLPDGAIEFLGRNDSQVKIRGFRIELGEIERQLLEVPGVEEAVVVAHEVSPGDLRLVAYFRDAETQGTEEAAEGRGATGGP